MNTFTYTVRFNGETFTGTFKVDSQSDAHDVDAIAWRLAQKQLAAETNAPRLEILWAVNSEALTVERNPVLINMLTGEKIVGPAGVNEEMLFEMMAV